MDNKMSGNSQSKHDWETVNVLYFLHIKQKKKKKIYMTTTLKQKDSCFWEGRGCDGGTCTLPDFRDMDCWVDQQRKLKSNCIKSDYLWDRTDDEAGCLIRKYHLEEQVLHREPVRSLEDVAQTSVGIWRVAWDGTKIAWNQQIKSWSKKILNGEDFRFLIIISVVFLSVMLRELCSRHCARDGFD